MNDIANFHAHASLIAEENTKAGIKRLIKDALEKQKAARGDRELDAETARVQVLYCALRIAEAPQDPRRVAGRVSGAKAQDDKDDAEEIKKGVRVRAG